MKKLITLTMVLALAAAFTTGCKQETKPAAPKADAAKPVQKPMSAKKLMLNLLMLSLLMLNLLMLSLLMLSLLTRSNPYSHKEYKSLRISRRLLFQNQSTANRPSN